MKKYITDFTVVGRRVYGDAYFAMELEHPGELPEIEAGQFVEVEVKGSREVMLRRPISVHDVDREHNRLTLLVQVVGNGTRRLSQIGEGERVSLVYPLGKGFLHGIGFVPQRPLLVGGGAGVAPLLYLSRCLTAQGASPTLLLGGRTAGLIASRDRFEAVESAHVHYSTEDGSLGEKGLVTQHSVFGKDYDAILCCGPTPMMRAVAREAVRRGVPCEVSLENRMACGVGACLCCVTETREGHKCVCKEGPVFTPQTLGWDNE